MALPTLVKTWQFDVGNTVSGTGGGPARQRQLIIDIKDAFIGFAQNPWTVVSSSDSVTADNTDRWSVVGDIVGASGAAPHSWIVLRQAAINANYEICISFGTPSGEFPSHWNFIWSPRLGFTGGLTTARPTAADEVILEGPGGIAWAGSFSGAEPANAHIFHVMMSEDGECTRLIGYYADVPFMFWAFEKPQNPVSGWTDPALCILASGDNVLSNAFDHSDMFDSSARAWGFHNGGNNDFKFYFAEESINTLGVTEINVANDLSSGDWPMSPIGILSRTSSLQGRHGNLFDMWWGAPVNANKEYPADASRQFMQSGHLIFPWNGTVVTRT